MPQTLFCVDYTACQFLIKHLPICVGIKALPLSIWGAAGQKPVWMGFRGLLEGCGQDDRLHSHNFYFPQLGHSNAFGHMTCVTQCQTNIFFSLFPFCLEMKSEYL